jgi:uncharacterized low-complexity protein
VEGKGGEGKYGKDISSYVGKGVVHEKKKCANKSMEGSCVLQVLEVEVIEGFP